MGKTHKKPAGRDSKRVKNKAPDPASPEEKAVISAALRMPDGRPSKYTEELAVEIALLISHDARPIHVMCNEEEGWPHGITIYRWEREHPEFRSILMDARRMRADRTMADAEQTTKDIKVRSRFGSNEISRQRLMNMLAQATATRLSRDWATKTQHEVAGPGGEAPVEIDYTNMSTDKLRQLRALQREAMGGSS